MTSRIAEMALITGARRKELLEHVSKIKKQPRLITVKGDIRKGKESEVEVYHSYLIDDQRPRIKREVDSMSLRQERNERRMETIDTSHLKGK